MNIEASSLVFINDFLLTFAYFNCIYTRWIEIINIHGYSTYFFQQIFWFFLQLFGILRQLFVIFWFKNISYTISLCYYCTIQYYVHSQRLASRVLQLLLMLCNTWWISSTLCGNAFVWRMSLFDWEEKYKQYHDTLDYIHVYTYKCCYTCKIRHEQKPVPLC